MRSKAIGNFHVLVFCRLKAAQLSGKTLAVRMTMSGHYFLAGVPATGKTWLGNWLAEQRGYIHIDAEKNLGADFDFVNLHGEWNELIETGRANSLVAAASRLEKPIVMNWGFPTRFLYLVPALQAVGVETWWLHGSRSQARDAFVARGGIDVSCFDRQMDDIEREWLLVSSVFRNRVIEGLRQDGSQRPPADLWSEITAAG